MAPNQQRLRAVRDAVAIVGIGETDYPTDYRRARDGERPTDAYGYAVAAFGAALADAGLRREDVDGLIAGPTLAGERLGEVLGLDPRWAATADAVNAVIQAVLAIHAGLAECVALVYGTDQRTARVAYGGPNAHGGDKHLAYVQYAPWGLTSQGALYAMLANRFLAETGMTEAELGEFVVAQRRYAQLNPAAVMRKPLTVPDYLATPYICDPLRLHDYCLVNDGGVALLVTTTERARGLQGSVVVVSGIGRSDMTRDAASLRPRLRDFYHPGHRAAAGQVYEMAGLGPEDIDVVQIYDSFSIHVPVALEGFGFCPLGEAAKLAGRTGPGGRLPVNTSGGHLSGSYMQGWGHQIEAVRQLRGDAGERQVERARSVQYLSDVAGMATSLIYRRDGS